MQPVILDVRALRKQFPGTLALDDFDLQVRRGEIVGLLGHNGSGKSTLVKVLSGLYEADAGAIRLGSDGADAFLHVIHQNLGLVPTLTVTENLDLVRRQRAGGLWPVGSDERDRAARLIGEFGGAFSVDVPVSQLTAAQQTIVALARAFDGWSKGDHVLVLDEPTAALHGDEVDVLHRAVRTVAAQGAGIVYISHRLGEVVDLADRVVVLRSGRVVAHRDRGQFDRRTLVDDIAGTVGSEDFRRTRASDPGEIRLAVRGLHGATVRGLDLNARAGEIVGIAGLVGSGMEELASVLYGVLPATAGSVHVDGLPLPFGSPRRAIGAGMAFVPADRRRLASIGAFPARENITLPRLKPVRSWTGAVSPARERADVRGWMRTVGVLPRDSEERRFDLFSGGNQQKIVLARCLRLNPAVLLLDEPTQGVDAGAQTEIYEALSRFVQAGSAVLVSSSDIKELVTVCDRILVLRDGVAAAEFSGHDLIENTIVRAVVDDGHVSASIEQDRAS
ncbi:sugar ABC transporter ATP-binding protein (plasmid) [Herbiconiux sp. KACC 21604]|uniref:sugar ABC transporter ATP-binding protein n=1 Tax=unclassified Herbiconiux TaxID=2618217 RepID=UPI00149155B3|nr:MULTISPECIES: sugar ABC transporter ATP-binding protein [unclassified Herbiconiux]QJU56306.1 sugar ABC transporter ATP-binding protein [Herbiconiux sp. SALV-R1]WPO88812.1 sugar ABC transporter ATP-binding protein [Herbiconiux sp. KACC 21604]